MATELRWSPKALEDIDDIYVRIGREQPSAAERFISRLDEKMRLLSEQPRMGVRRPEVASSFRQLVEAPYVIFYEIVPDSDDGPVEWVEIVRILDGRRDLPNAL